MSYDRNNAIRQIKNLVADHTRKIANVFAKAEPDHESAKLCPRCIRQGNRILMGIQYNPKITKQIPEGKRVYVCGTCQLLVSETIGQSPLTGALNPDDVVSLINNPKGHPKITPSELSDYNKRHTVKDSSEHDTRFLKDIVADLEKNHITNLHGNNRYMFKRRNMSTTSSDIHNQK